jgi:hypothetical protein
VAAEHARESRDPDGALDMFLIRDSRHVDKDTVSISPIHEKTQGLKGIENISQFLGAIFPNQGCSRIK